MDAGGLWNFFFPSRSLIIYTTLVSKELCQSKEIIASVLTIIKSIPAETAAKLCQKGTRHKVISHFC